MYANRPLRTALSPPSCKEDSLLILLFIGPWKFNRKEEVPAAPKEEPFLSHTVYENTVSFNPSLYPDFDPYEIPDGVDEED